MKVSFVVAAVSGEPALTNCVESLRRHAGAYGDFELVVISGAPQAVFGLRAQGLAQATGDRVVVIGDRYEVTAEWAAAVFGDLPFDVTGGCLAPSTELDYWGWTVFLSEYAHVAPPALDSLIVEPRLLMGGNVVYAASVIHRVRPDPIDTDLTFHATLLAVNASAGVSSALLLRFACPPGLSEYVRERFWFSRSIAANRKGVWRLFVAPLLPLLVLWRTGSTAVRKRNLGLKFLLCAPAIGCLAFVQAVGECVGALDSIRRNP